MKITTCEHSTGINEFYLDHEKDSEMKDFIFCAVGRDASGANIKQIDLGEYTYKEMKDMLKSMKKYIKEHKRHK